MDSNPHEPSGICQRLIRLVLGALRRPSTLPAASTQVLIEEGSLANGKDSLSSEIVVDFRHTTDSVVAKDGLVLSNDQTILQNGVNKKLAKGKGVKKSVSVTIQESERRKEANHSADQATAEVDDQLQDDTKSRRHWPLLNVTSNINEKSEAFIERKKKAMSRNYSLEQDQKK